MDLMATALAATLVTLAQTAPAGSGPTLAREDTLHTEVPEVLVAAPRVTLDEILDRVARGEARRESLLTEQAFTAAVVLTLYLGWRILRELDLPRGPAVLLLTLFGTPLFYYGALAPSYKHASDTLYATARGLKYASATREQFVQGMTVAVRAMCAPLREAS